MNKQDIKNAIKNVDDKLSGFSDDGKLRKIYTTIREALEHQLTNGWIPVSEQLPDKSEYLDKFNNTKGLLATLKSGEVINTYFTGIRFYTSPNNYHVAFQDVIAWQPLPEPYKEETK